MPVCKLRTYNALEAKKGGVKLSLADRLILLRSSPFVHTEFQFSDRYADISFSFTMQDDVHGARFKRIWYSHPEWWDTIPIECDERSEDLAFELAAEYAGFADPQRAMDKIYNGENLIYTKEHYKYDLIGLLTFCDDEPTYKDNLLLKIIRPILWSWTAIVKPDPKRMWCSEGCAHLALMALPLGASEYIVPETETPLTLRTKVLKEK